jgi:hypothetical protein
VAALAGAGLTLCVIIPGQIRDEASGCDVASQEGMCGRPLRCKKNRETGAARDRVLPCVRPLVRHDHGRGPVWEFGDQVHIIGTRSRRCPFAWFS